MMYMLWCIYYVHILMYVVWCTARITYVRSDRMVLFQNEKERILFIRTLRWRSAPFQFCWISRLPPLHSIVRHDVVHYLFLTRFKHSGVWECAAMWHNILAFRAVHREFECFRVCVLDDVGHSVKASFARVHCYFSCGSISYWEQRWF